MDHVPEAERPWVRRKLRAAWANPNAVEAEAAPRGTRRPTRARRPTREGQPDAAASLREGLAETVAVTRLGITGSLLKTVMSTNPVEIEIAASNQFRRVKSYRQLPQLAHALRHTVRINEPSVEAVTA